MLPSTARNEAGGPVARTARRATTRRGPSLTRVNLDVAVRDGNQFLLIPKHEQSRPSAVRDANEVLVHERRVGLSLAL